MKAKRFVHVKLIYKLIFLLIVQVIYTNCEDKDAEIKELREQIEALQSQVDSEKEAKEKAEKERSETEDHLAKTKKDAANAKEDAEQRIASLESDIEELNKDLESAISEEEAISIWNEYRAALNSAKQFILTQANYTQTDVLDELEKAISRMELLFKTLERNDIDTYEFVEEVNKVIASIQKPEDQLVLKGSQYGVIKLKAGNIYFLDGLVEFQSGAVLEIEPGTIIKGKKYGQGSIGMLLVHPNASIFAEGTADQPIIFTHEDDPIQADGTYPAGSQPPKLDHFENPWGGLYILGNATWGQGINPLAPRESYGAATGPEGNDIRFGGDHPMDDSGVLSYVSIRHAGTIIQQGDSFDIPISSLYLGGVGSQTTVNHIEIFGSATGAIAVIGGTVDISEVVISAAQMYEGSVYMDGFIGSFKNSIIEMGQEVESGLWVVGHSDKNLPISDRKITLSNITIFGYDLGRGECPSRESEVYFTIFENDLNGTIENIHYLNVLSDDFLVSIEDSETAENLKNENLKFQSLKVQFSDGCDPSPLGDLFIDYGSEDDGTNLSIDPNIFTEIITESNVDYSPFTWTYWYQNKQSIEEINF